MTERKVTIIAPAAIVEAARAACEQVPGGAGMFLAQTSEPTHYVSAGYMSEDIIAAAEAAGCIVSEAEWSQALSERGLELLP